MEEVYLKELIKNSKKIKDKEDRDLYLIKHSICPVCLESTLTKDASDTYCTKCGYVVDEPEFYMSHGTTKESGDRVEIYTPASNLSNRSTPTRGFRVEGRMSSKNREKYARLSKIDFYVKASGTNSSMLKSLRRIVSVMNHNQSMIEKHIIEETALMIHKKVQKYINDKKKTNIYTIITLTFLFLGIPINTRLLYDTLLSDKTFAHFKKNTNKGIEEIMKKMTPEEKKEIKKKLTEQILKAYKISYTEKDIDKIYDVSQEIINLAPNNGIENTIRTIIEIKKYNKIHNQFKFGKNKDKILSIIKKVNIVFGWKIMRFLHISDTHFDYVPNINFLDQEKYTNEKFESIKQAIEYAKENNIKYIVHSGDVFDRIRPNIKYIIKLMKIIHGAEKSGITFIMISGNHDQPKIKSVFNSLAVLETLDNVKMFIEPGVFTATDGDEKVDFICIPSPNEWGSFSKNFNSILDETLKKSKEQTRVLVTHIQISNIEDKATEEVEPFFSDGYDSSQLPKLFVYSALGHIHKMQEVDKKNNMWYAGSSSLLSFNEIGTKKYFIDVEIKKDKVLVNPIEINLTYDLINIEIDASKILSNDELLKSILYYSKGIKLEDNVVKITLQNYTKTFLSFVNIPDIVKELKEKNPLGIKIDLKRNEDEVKEENTNTSIESLMSLIKPMNLELHDYLENIKLSEDQIKEITALNSEVMSMIEAQEEVKKISD